MGTVGNFKGGVVYHEGHEERAVWGFDFRNLRDLLAFVVSRKIYASV
jgi:hypothetical protein